MKKMMMGVSLMFLSLIGLMLSGCNQQQAAAQPEPIEEGVDKCAVCHMNVADGPHATQIQTTDGEHFKFDDIGCMVRDWMPEHDASELEAIWVRDYETKEWLLFENAYYVYDNSIKTPMAYGVLSFKTEEKAQAYIDEHGVGTLMQADELQNQHNWERNMEMMQKMKENMNMDHQHN